MFWQRIWVTDFRNYESAELELDPSGVNVIVGGNGQGKTNLIEAVAYLAGARSFRGAPTEAMIKQGAGSAIVRGAGSRSQREILVEAEIKEAGRGRLQLNGQRLYRARGLLEGVRVTVFSPEDLRLVKSGPAARRELLDDLLASLEPRNVPLEEEVERVLRQRNALLKSAGGRLTPDVGRTLDIWDSRFAELGEALADARQELCRTLTPRVTAAYERLAGAARTGLWSVDMEYSRSWTGSLAGSILAARGDDLRRGVSTVGPHRDDVVLSIEGMPARTHGSQGEQRALALGLRLAGHQLVAERLRSTPVLLLDDVLSELDPQRSAALLDSLPEGQALLTTAGELPAGAKPSVVVGVEGGRLSAKAVSR